MYRTQIFFLKYTISTHTAFVTASVTSRTPTCLIFIFIQKKVHVNVKKVSLPHSEY